jgi:hypothetical protein
MKWPTFPKLKLPKFNFRSNTPNLFQARVSFYSEWKKFIRQIPTESRSIIKTHQHFVVMGAEKSGKTDLIQGLIEQSQDLYPFETTLTELPEMQFYLGPRQVIQEMSFATLENRSIKVRKQVIKLWKRLYAVRDPVILIACDCWAMQNGDIKEANRLAQWIAGKITLLSEICKKPLKTRIALTHMDKIPGYLEFARFLKQQNISYTINLSSNFESETLTNHFKEFSEKHLSLVLTSVSQEDYLKILLFFKEMPSIFPAIEEFMRALATRVSFKDAIELEMLAFTSNQESSTSFPLFQWEKTKISPLFFRYPMLKHQLAAACVAVTSLTLIFNQFYRTRGELLLVQEGLELLDLLQFSAFRQKIVPSINKIAKNHSHRSINRIDTLFFENKLKIEKNRLAHRIRKHIIESEYRKTILENKGELKYLYFVGLMRSSADNRIGKFIQEHASQWAHTLNLEEDLMKIYISCCSEPVPVSELSESKASPFLSLTSQGPWISFLKKFEEVKHQPIFVEQTYEEIIRETEKLLLAISRLRNDPLVFKVATLLHEEGFVDNENVKTIHWVGHNVDALENFLVFLKQTYVPPTNMQGINPSQFFVMIKDFASKSESENELYNFELMGHLFSFDSNMWSQQVVAHNIEKALQEYMALNADTDGSIFFYNTGEAPVTTLAHTQGVQSFFTTNITIPGRYSRIDYERKVRSTVEKLGAFVESLTINPEEKKRFIGFLLKESTNYIKCYQEKYVNLFDTYAIEAQTLKDLKKLFSDLTKSTSSFYEFLRTIQHQTSSFSDSLLTLKNIDDYNNFAFLTPILAEKDGKAPLEEYRLLVCQILRELEDISGSASHHIYSSLQLTPVEKMSVDIFHKTPESYLKKVEECLAQLGVPERFNHLFYKPILLLHEVGLKELKTSFEHYWKMHIYPQVESVFSKFPFNLNETALADLDTVSSILSPKSNFYTDIEKMIAIFCTQKDGRWVPIDSNRLGLEDSIYDQLNRISKISRTLWDFEGNPKPLVFKVSPIPFIDSGTAAAVPVKSCIIAGAQSIHNINQDPSWQTLNVEWWKPDQSLVGMTVVNKGSNSKSYRSIQPPTKLWSFFALLKEGVHKESNIWDWTLATREGQDTQHVAFHFETDPTEILNYQEIR